MCFSLVCSLWILKHSANAKIMDNVNSLGNFKVSKCVSLGLGKGCKGLIVTYNVLSATCASFCLNFSCSLVGRNGQSAPWWLYLPIRNECKGSAAPLHARHRLLTALLPWESWLCLLTGLIGGDTWSTLVCGRDRRDTVLWKHSHTL